MADTEIKAGLSFQIRVLGYNRLICLEIDNKYLYVEVVLVLHLDVCFSSACCSKLDPNVML
jgi:predicted protein tyrosine phosphatase